MSALAFRFSLCSQVKEIKKAEVDFLRKSTGADQHHHRNDRHSTASSAPSRTPRGRHAPTNLAPTTGSPHSDTAKSGDAAAMVPVPPSEPREAVGTALTDEDKVLRAVVPAVGMERAQSFRDGVRR